MHDITQIDSVKNAEQTPARSLIVTSIERSRSRRSRVDVYINGERRFEIGRATATQRGLRPGLPIESAEIDAIVAADARRTAMETAAAMLARRPRSEREIRRRLALRKHDPALIDETIGRLRSLKLIDDAEFARSWTESRDRSSPRGQRLIVQELRASGVDATTARDAADEIAEPDAAYRAASARLRSLRDLDRQAFRNRLGGYLQRRGFGWDVVRATVDRCWAELGAAVATAEEDDFEEAIE